jgi:hypothetical protein
MELPRFGGASAKIVLSNIPVWASHGLTARRNTFEPGSKGILAQPPPLTAHLALSLARGILFAMMNAIVMDF